MTIATKGHELPTQPASNEQAVPAIDPEHDMDPVKTTMWLSISLAFVIVTLWVLSYTFGFSLQSTRQRKIGDRPAQELHQLRSKEDYQLKQQTPPDTADTRSLPEINASIGATTDDIIQKYIDKN